VPVKKPQLQAKYSAERADVDDEENYDFNDGDFVTPLKGSKSLKIQNEIVTRSGARLEDHLNQFTGEKKQQGSLAK